jgi:predicted TIM-barrel fold metal-dependent hydrolase
LIDCDVHCAPASWEALAPHLTDNWRQYVESGGIPLASSPQHAYPPGAATSGAQPPATYEDLHERLLERTEASHLVLNCPTMFDAIRNPYLQAGLARALNDWLRTEWLDRDPRLRASIVVPWADPAAAADEIERAGEDPRFVQVLLPIRAELPWGHKSNQAIHAAAARTGVAVCLHAWGLWGHAPSGSALATSYVEDYLSNATIVQHQLVNLVAEGMFDRHPDLHVVVAECGFAWLPPLLWRTDKHWRSFWPEVPWVKEKPSRYVEERVRVTTAPAHLGSASAEEIREVVDMIGATRLLYASDYPHDHGPSDRRLLDALDETGREAVLAGNAAALYRLD